MRCGTASPHRPCNRALSPVVSPDLPGVHMLTRRSFLLAVLGAMVGKTRLPVRPAGDLVVEGNTHRSSRHGDRMVTLFLCGDVMTGRGIDQVLPHPGDPGLHEPWVRSAREYVALAEAVNGLLPEPLDYAYVWGDALAEFDRVRPDARIINLETAVTASDARVDKGINYRMHPNNIPVLTAAGIDCAVLANNHVLDWGTAGLLETLQVLDSADIRTAGAGRDRGGAATPAVIDLGDKGRVLVLALGAESSGIPRDWAATAERGRCAAGGAVPRRSGGHRWPGTQTEAFRRHRRRLPPLGWQLGLRRTP